MEGAGSPIRLGMIGCGLISHAHGRAAHKSTKDIKFVACASRNLSKSKAWAEAYGCDAYYSDYTEMLRQENLDGVVIATWPTGHRAQIEAVLAAGVRYILCEKSLATNGEDALAIWNAASRSGATVIEAFMYRYHDAILKAGAIVRAKELGQIDSIHGVFHMFDPEVGNANDAERNWRQQQEAGGGVVYDFLCYPVDAANKFANSLPVRAFSSGSRSEKFGVLNRLYGHIEYANGCIAMVESSRKACFRQSLQVTGDKAILDVPFAWSSPGEITLVKTESPSFLAEEKTYYQIPPSDSHDGRLIDFPVYTRQLNHFADVIREAVPPVMPLAESVVTAIVLEALERSYNTGQPSDITVPADIAAACAIHQ